MGEQIEIMKPDGRNVEIRVGRIVNEDGEEQESAPHAKQVLYVELGTEAEKYDILRRAEQRPAAEGDGKVGLHFSQGIRDGSV